MQSPLKLFRSLKHGDPQAVAFTAVFVFLLSVCWFSWTLLVPPTDAALPFAGGRVAKKSVEEPLSLKEILEMQQVFLTPQDVPNPFYREPPQKPPPRNKKASGNQGKNQGKNQADPQPKQNNPSSKSSSPKPQVEESPKTRSLTLTYQGLLTRPDKTTVALISIAEENSSRYLKTGENIDPFTILDISPELLEIKQENGPALLLPRGKTQRFEIPL